MFGVRLTYEDTVVDEPTKAVGKDVARKPDAALKVFKAPRAVKRLTQNNPYPAFA